jgi:molybdopterin/thiamine biosynthesis adenylyltransferase
MKTEHVNIIGLGGIGSWLFRAIVPIIYGDHSRQWRLQLVDGDHYEAKNLSRQLFAAEALSQNKAEANESWLRQRFGEPEHVMLLSQNRYVTPELLPSVIGERSTTLLCVDNHVTRKQVSDFTETLKDAILISGGNDSIDGNVQVMLRRRGRALTPTLGQWHPEIATPTDKHPSDVSCAELAAAGDGQTIAANFFAASLMLNAFYFLQFTPKPVLKENEYYFDILRNDVVGRVRKHNVA